MKAISTIILATLCSLFFLLNSYGQNLPERIYYVTVEGDSDCNDNHCGLQAALDTAAMDSANVTILVAKGTYYGAFTHQPDSGYGYGNLVLEGGWNSEFTEQELNPVNTIIDGEDLARTLSINKYPAKSFGGITLRGFTIRNGVSEGAGGGALLQTYAPGDILVDKNIIEDNKTQNTPGNTRVGGGLLLYGFDPVSEIGVKITISNNQIRNNEAGVGSGGQGGGLFTYCTDSLFIFNNIVTGNICYGAIGQGGGIEIYSSGGYIFVSNNTISENMSYGYGGGTGSHILTSAYKNSHFRFHNNIIYDNTSNNYGQDAFSGTWDIYPAPGNSIEYHYNIIGNHYTYPGCIIPVYENNITTDPNFADTLYHVAPSSPAVNAGMNAVPFVPDLDFDGRNRILDDVIDIGAFEHTGLVAHYRLNGDATDRSWNGLDGMVINAGMTTDMYGVDNSAILIDSDDEAISVPFDPEMNISGKITLSAWIHPYYFNEHSFIISKGRACVSNGNYNLSLFKGASVDFDRLSFTYFDGLGVNNYFVADDTLTQNRWYHVAATCDYQTYDVKLYVNGKEVTGYWVNSDIPAGGPVLTTSNLGIGAIITHDIGCNGKVTGDPQNVFYGKIDEVKIYNKILGGDEIFFMANLPPNGIEISSDRLNENSPLGTTVGTLSAMDPNYDDVHAFQFVTGDGINDQHNSWFAINGDLVQTAAEINYEVNQVCHFLVEVKDEAEHVFTRPFVIDVQDMNDPPKLANPIADVSATEAIVFSYDLSGNNVFFDEDPWDHLATTASLSDNSALPGWLGFSSQLFSGTPGNSDVGEIIIKVTATDDSAAFAVDEFVLTVDPASSVDELIAKGFRIYPDPVKDKLFIETGEIDVTDFSVISVVGATVYECKLIQDDLISVDLSDLERGIYFYLCEGKGVRYTGRFVKQ